MRGLCTEGNLLFKIDWASFLWEGNLPFLVCFTLYSRANSKYKLPGGGGLYLEGLINGGAYFRNFTVYRNSGKEKESRCLLFTSSTKREIRYSHVVVVQ